MPHLQGLLAVNGGHLLGHHHRTTVRIPVSNITNKIPAGTLDKGTVVTHHPLDRLVEAMAETMVLLVCHF